MNEAMVKPTLDWPYNLLNALEIEADDPLTMLDDIGTLEVAMALSSMTPREKKVIRMRYMGNMTQEAIGNEIGVTKSRVREIEAKALRKLRYPTVCGFILKYGVKAYVQKRVNEGIEARLKVKEEELNKVYLQKLAEIGSKTVPEEVNIFARIKSIPVEEMDLSVRAYNCLKRAMCNTVNDIITRYPDYEHAYMIRNLGRKSLEEISEKLWSYGIKWPAENEVKSDA